MTNLTLYQFEECPYCEKVRAKLNQLRLKYEKVNVPKDREHPLRKKLLQASGVPTVPVLKIEDNGQEKYLGESDLIINYLEQNH